MKKLKLILLAALVALMLVLGILLLVIAMVRTAEEQRGGESPPIWVEEPALPSGSIEDPAVPHIPNIVGKEEGIDLPLVVALDLREQVKAMVLQGEYGKADAYLLEALKPYRAEGTRAYEAHLEALRGDLAGLAQLPYLAGFEDIDSMYRVVRNLRDPFTFTAGVLWVEPIDRAPLLGSRNSLNPFYGVIEYIGDPQRLSLDIPGFTEGEPVYGVDIVLDGKTLTAIVVDVYSILHLHAIEAREGTAHDYQTLQEYEDMMREFRQGEDLP